MKTTTTILVLIFIFAFCVSGFSQQQKDYDFQGFQVEVQKVLKKAPENLSKEDIKYLESIRKKNPKEFGSEYQQGVKNLQVSADKKIQDYFILMKQKQITKDKEIIITDQEKDLKDKEGQIDQLGVQLTSKDSLIRVLTNRMNRLENERKSLVRFNAKLKKETETTKQLLDNSTAQVNRIARLIKPLRGKSEVTGRDDNLGITNQLEATECGVSELLKTNFTLTLKNMEDNPKFMDSVISYYRNNKVYPVEIINYLESGLRLADTLRVNPLECVKKNGETISASIIEFKEKVEAAGGGFWTKVANFIKQPLFIIIAILLLLIGASVFLLTTLKKKKT